MTLATLAPLRRFAVAALLALLTLPALAPPAAAQDPAPSRTLYRGEGAAAGWLLELRQGADAAAATLTPMLPREPHADALELEGAWDDGTLSLAGADASLLLRPAPGADASTALLAATVRIGDASGEGRFALLAEIAELRYRQAEAEVTTTLPRVVDPAWDGVDALLAAPYLHGHDAAVAELMQLRADLGPRWAYWIDTTVELTYLDEELLAFAEAVSSYTGGAHGNLTFGSRAFALGPRGPEPLPLAGLFAAGAGALPAVAARVAAELRAQGAAWLEEPDSTLTPEELSDWVLTPAGIAFRFEPYAVGPYAQGPFEVALTYRALSELAAPSDLLARLVERHAAAP